MDRVLEKIFRVGSGTDWVRVLASYKKPIGYYRVLKNLIGYFSGISSMRHIYFMECLVRDCMDIYRGIEVYLRSLLIEYRSSYSDESSI